MSSAFYVGDDQPDDSAWLADDSASQQLDMQMDDVFDADSTALDDIHVHMQLMQHLQVQEPPDFVAGMPMLISNYLAWTSP